MGNWKTWWLCTLKIMVDFRFETASLQSLGCKLIHLLVPMCSGYVPCAYKARAKNGNYLQLRLLPCLTCFLNCMAKRSNKKNVSVSVFGSFKDVELVHCSAPNIQLQRAPVIESHGIDLQGINETMGKKNTIQGHPQDDVTYLDNWEFAPNSWRIRGIVKDVKGSKFWTVAEMSGSRLWEVCG